MNWQPLAASVKGNSFIRLAEWFRETAACQLQNQFLSSKLSLRLRLFHCRLELRIPLSFRSAAHWNVGLNVIIRAGNWFSFSGRSCSTHLMLVIVPHPSFRPDPRLISTSTQITKFSIFFQKKKKNSSSLTFMRVDYANSWKLTKFHHPQPRGLCTRSRRRQ